MNPRSVLASTVLLAALVAACGGQADGDRPHAASSAASSAGPSTSSSTSTPATKKAASTPKLDSMVVLDHSGTTGYASDPSNPDGDALDNSWATGGNPRVDSVYRRLLATHPALESPATNLGVDGSTVDQLDDQVTEMLDLEPLPDVVIIQTIDDDRYAQVFLASQWGFVQTYTDAIAHRADAVAGSSGNEPCDTFTESGKERPAGIASEQKIVDGYWSQITHVCAAHRGCFTDRGHLQKMPVGERDLTGDSNHLDARGVAVMAKYAWEALPDAIKNRS